MPRLLGPIDCAYIIYKLNWVNKEEEEEVEESERGIRIGFVICYVYGERKDETMIVHDQQHIRSNMLKPNNYISGEKATNDQPIMRIESFTLSYLWKYILKLIN